MKCPLQGLIRINTLDELFAGISKIKDQLNAEGSGRGGIGRLLFRGQADSRWGLESTLERGGRIGQILCADYLALAESIRDRVEGEGMAFPMPDLQCLFKALLLPNRKLQFLDEAMLRPLVSYWIHLRHHRFPSPLLDWTNSLETALWFAFASAPAASVSIYVFCEYPKGVKGGWAAAPMITSLSHQICNLDRHERQSAEYTFCTVPYSDNKVCSFTRHQEAFGNSDGEQDWVIKFDLPSALKKPALKYAIQIGVRREQLLPPAPLDRKLDELINEVFGTERRAQPFRIR